jgi:spermidine synthase
MADRGPRASDVTADPSSRPTVVARVDTSHGEWVLRRGVENGRPVFEVIGNGSFLMDTREAGSEEALARLALEGRPASSVLIGGLGLGFTLRKCLSFEPKAVDVAEIEPTVVEWVSGPVAEVFGNPLESPVVRVITCDVFEVLRAADAAYDVILLDTDNGPSWLVYPENEKIYGLLGLDAVSRALRPKGTVAIWSAQEETELQDRMEKHFGNVHKHVIEVTRDGRVLEYFVYTATVPDEAALSGHGPREP